MLQDIVKHLQNLINSSVPLQSRALVDQGNTQLQVAPATEFCWEWRWPVNARNLSYCPSSPSDADKTKVWACLRDGKTIFFQSGLWVRVPPEVTLKHKRINLCKTSDLQDSFKPSGESLHEVTRSSSPSLSRARRCLLLAVTQGNHSRQIICRTTWQKQITSARSSAEPGEQFSVQKI